MEQLLENGLIYSVSALSHAIKGVLEGNFNAIQVRGEMSGVKYHSSGHLYFTLKDSEAIIDCVCWRHTLCKIPHKAEEGLEVNLLGRITTYSGRSKYQIIVEKFDPSGEGALLKLLEQRKQKLRTEGLFDAHRKKPLPFIPNVIGVITSPTGAVIRDILHRLNDRFPRHVLVWPVHVQGSDAAGEIIGAIQGFNNIQEGSQVPRPDVLLLARGGGSLEDLWVFNDEAVVRAVAESRIPIISAIGHETDTTLVDYASDLRAPTPTAAAEMVVPVRAEIYARVLENGRRITNAFLRDIKQRNDQLHSIERRLKDPHRLAEEKLQRLLDWENRLQNGLRSVLHKSHFRFDSSRHSLRPPYYHLQTRSEKFISSANHLTRLISLAVLKPKSQQLASTEQMLKCYSYQQTLKRGFALVTDTKGKLVKSAKSLKSYQSVSLTLQDGVAQAIALPKKRAHLSSFQKNGELPIQEKLF